MSLQLLHPCLRPRKRFLRAEAGARGRVWRQHLTGTPTRHRDPLVRNRDPPLPAALPRGAHLVGDVVDHDGRLRPPVVHGGQAVVPLLAGRVPDLKLHRCVVQADGLCEKRRWREAGRRELASNGRPPAPCLPPDSPRRGTQTPSALPAPTQALGDVELGVWGAHGPSDTARSVQSCSTRAVGLFGG